MRDAAYHRAWRAAHPEYRERQNQLRNERRRLKGRGDRAVEYRKRKSRANPRLTILMPHLQRGARVSFWEDELRLDLAQEAALAVLEGRDPREAVREYQKRELFWRAITAPLLAS